MRHVFTTKLEHLQLRRGDAGCFGDIQTARGRKVESRIQTAGEDVGGRNAGGRELLDRRRRLGSGEHGPRAGVQSRFAQKVHVGRGLVRACLHVRHLLVELGELGHSEAHADPESCTHAHRGRTKLGERLPLLVELVDVGAGLRDLLLDLVHPRGEPLSREDQ